MGEEIMACTDEAEQVRQAYTGEGSEQQYYNHYC